VNGLIRVLDDLFWKRFADEYQEDPESPSSACFEGMFSVALILFFGFVALLTPLSRLLMFAVNAISHTAAAEIPHRDAWFTVVAVASALLSGLIVRRRYWRFRLVPEAAAPYLGMDRFVIATKALGMLAAAIAMTCLMFWLFW
jgi:hypothetical protein